MTLEHKELRLVLNASTLLRRKISVPELDPETQADHKTLPVDSFHI